MDKMLTDGDRAPEFDLEAVDGKRYALNDRLTLAIFFKTDCPTCQYAWPFFERLHAAYSKAGLQIWGISQHDRNLTRQFGKEYGSHIPLLLDTERRVTAGYRPDFVPTGFLIAGRTVRATFESWNKLRFIELGQQVATSLQVAAKPLVRQGEQVAEFRPG